MSIVENALNKLSAAKRAERDGRVEQAAAEGAAVAQPADAAPTVPAAAPLRPAQSIDIDLGALTAADMYPRPEIAGRIADQFRRVKWALLAGATSKGANPLPHGNLVMVTSAVPAEGKSFISLNLALSLAAERELRVLLIDADIAMARISRLLGVGEAPGLTDVLADGSTTAEDVILGTSIPGLAILPAGRPDPNSPELFASRRMEHVLHGLEARDPDQLILIDSAPLLATNEAQVLSGIVGQTLMVVRAEETPQAAVLEALALVDASRPTHLVLNQTRAGLFGDPYSNYYYAYDRVQRA